MTEPVGPHWFDRTGAWTPSRPAPPRLATSARSSPLRRKQRACYEALGLALKEGNVFAALTGPAGSGKTTVLEAVLADRQDRSIRFIRIDGPDRVPASLAAQIEQVATIEAGKPENQERHIVFAIDDAHTASEELLGCLTRLATIREPGRRVPQLLLVGRPELWTRLAAPEYEIFARRIAVRAVLPEAGRDDDPWASVERDVIETLQHDRAGPQRVPPDLFDPGFGIEGIGSGTRNPLPLDETTLPPSLFALFPDAPARAAAKPAPMKSRWRKLLLVPVAALMLGAAAFLLLDERSGLTGGWAPAWAPAPAPVAPSRPAPATVAPATPAQEATAMPPAPAQAEAPPAVVPAPSSPPRPPETVQAVPVPPAPALAPAAPAAAPLSASIVAMLLRRGDEQTGIGDISAARLLYERAAESGNAVAALHLAQTYDAAFLPQADAATLADPAAAHDWYVRAAALGSKEAATRLQTLNRVQ